MLRSIHLLSCALPTAYLRGFKILFGQEINKDLLIDFLNDLFDDERSITDLTLLNVELPSESIEGRGAIFDLKCRDAEGIAAGLIEGEVKGVRRTARNMKNEGLSLDFIMKCTGLSEEEINNL